MEVIIASYPHQWHFLTDLNKTLIETTPIKHISQIYTCQSWLPLGAFCQTTIPARLYQFLKAKSKMKRTMQNDELLIKHLYS